MQKPTPDSSWLKKFWYFIWYDDSAASWVANIALAFLLIKFIVYPAIGAVFSTTYPVVAVISDSMEHDSSFDSWWQSQSQFYIDNGISKGEFEDFRFTNGFNRGDVMVLFGTPFEEVVVGDVIVFTAARPYPIIHRVVQVHNQTEGFIVETKGDNNLYQIKSPQLDETSITRDEYLGTAVLRIPWIGYVKIWFAEILQFIGLGALV